ncbi:MAG: DUF4231 domain-containing protein [Pseudonocardia sp.]
MKRPALLVRFPSLRVPSTSWPVIPPDEVAAYPSLAEDIATLDAVVGASFDESDRAALVQQNRYRRQQLVILLGSAVLSGLGGLQAVFPEQRWPGLLLVVLGCTLAVISRAAGELNTLSEFLTERVKAERLRAVYFRFLSRTGRYAGPDRVTVLRRAVVSIKAGEEPT